ncbi:hypothetical protein Y1Q_0002038 [Alligator mississippiensis]|uniref:Uncharacterized protein n=1 Tax=Alligator mississippiensis TaxID=8496 RepID=A0A151MIP7_ALLMI|nr:hypothetical protein Y1Q_0002038 [Alligator mississippiensis]
MESDRLPYPSGSAAAHGEEAPVTSQDTATISWHPPHVLPPPWHMHDRTLLLDRLVTVARERIMDSWAWQA